MPARTAARPRSRATAPARSASRSSCARRSRRCRCSGWMPTRRGARAASRPSSTASPPRLPASSWAPRWSLRATTSRRSSWPSSRTPTPTLRFPDFRAEERTFSLVAQLAGRSGRGPGGGRVLVQTLCPRLPACATPPRHDAAGFLAEEVERRRALRYPPFSTLIRVLASAPDQAVCRRAAELLGIASAAACSAAASTCSARRRCSASRTCAAADAGDQDRRPRGRGRGRGRRRCSRSAASAARRGVKLAVDVDPQ